MNTSDDSREPSHSLPPANGSANIHDNSAVHGGVVGANSGTIYNTYNYNTSPPLAPTSNDMSSTPPIMRPPRVWLSPSSSSHRDFLAVELRMRGILVERDPATQRSELEKQLENADCIIVYRDGTQQPSSDYAIAQWLAHHPDQPPYLINDTDQPLDAMWQRIVDDSRPMWQIDPNRSAQEQCKTWVQTIAQKIIKAHIMHQGEIVIAFQSSSAIDPKIEAHLALDWSDFYEDVKLGARHWHDGHQALRDLRAWLPNGRTIKLLTSSLDFVSGFMFGSVFYYPASGYTVEIQNTHTKSWWIYDPMAGTSDEIEAQVLTTGEPPYTACTLELSLVGTQNATSVQQTMTRFIDQQFASPLYRITAHPRAHESLTIATSQQASQLIITLMQMLRAKGPCTTTHILAAIPVALAVMLGQQINSLGTFHWHEYDKETSTYMTDTYPIVASASQRL